MLRETTEWEERGSLPLNYKESDVAMKGRHKPVKLPQKITGDLAEEIGIHISDGTMGMNVVDYCGHEEEDGVYLRYYVLPLLKRLWGIKNVGWKAERDNKCLKLKMYSRRIVRFKERVLGLPRGSKEDIKIPERFMRRRCWVNRLLTGLFDGDGSISFKSKAGLAHTYPVISLTSTNEGLVRQVQELLRRLEFIVPSKFWKRENGVFSLQLNGDKNYERWLNTVGFNNPKHLTKVVLYEKCSVVPPDTNLEERRQLIRGELKLEQIYDTSQLRINENRVIEKEVLKLLFRGNSWIKELGKQLNVYKERVMSALRRLAKQGLVKCIKSERRGKQIYQLTPWGVKKLKRVEEIEARLKQEFHLAV